MSPVSIRSEQRISASRGTGSSDRLTSVYLSLCGHTPQVRTEEGKSIDQVAFAMAAARDADRFERVAAEQRYAFPARTHTTTILVSCSQPTVSLLFVSDSAPPASVSYVSGAAAGAAASAATAEPSASRRKLRV